MTRHMAEMVKLLQQYAALPVMGSGDRVQVLLVTSRGTGRWIIPKGHPEKKMKPSEVAAMEAFEEGGVSGTVGKVPLGHYQSAKRLASGTVVPCEVTVFRLDVTEHRLRKTKRRMEVSPLPSQGAKRSAAASFQARACHSGSRR